MHNQVTIDRFVDLRAQGWSFERIAKEINVSKPTLIIWGRKHRHLIQNLRAIESEVLIEHLLSSHKERCQKLAQDLSRFEEELSRRDLASLPTANLVSIIQNLRANIKSEAGPTQFSDSKLHIPPDELEEHESTLSWNV